MISPSALVPVASQRKLGEIDLLTVPAFAKRLDGANRAPAFIGYGTNKEGSGPKDLAGFPQP